MKTARHVRYRRLRPKKFPSQPVMGRLMALATRNDVSTHVISSTPAENVPAMCGRATFATEVSSTSMNVPSMAVKAMRYLLSVFMDIVRPPTTKCSAPLAQMNRWGRATACPKIFTLS